MLAAILPFAIIGLIIFGLPALAFAIVVIGVWAVRRAPPAGCPRRRPRVTRRWVIGLVVGGGRPAAGTLVAGPIGRRCSGSSPIVLAVAEAPRAAAIGGVLIGLGAGVARPPRRGRADVPR